MQDKIPVNARFDRPLLDRVDNWRRQQAAIPPRSEALRELIRRALHAEERRQSERQAA
jgi:metal-responsive CopG/Arc/MetJ family transcriptional regulator